MCWRMSEESWRCHCEQGDMTYAVVIQPDQLDDRLRLNMTAAVAIEPH
jgi:hypothetical protein